MGLSLYNIKKWYRMLTGKSVLHVQQDLGKAFVPGKLGGYFNNMTQKVTMEPALLETDDLPQLQTEKGETVYFPVAIFQYGLGAWDLYLQTGEDRYQKKFLQCADWALVNQEETGAWSNFFFYYPDHPYGAMCQGEGASLLVRAWHYTKDDKYLQAARCAIDRMIEPVENGGMTQYSGDDVVFLEYTHRPAVLNGWIFALFGLYDLVLSNSEEKYRQVLDKTVATLESKLSEFDNGYWSLYDMDGRITSPFYHDLHIAQMEALYLATRQSVFNEYNLLFKKYRSKKWNYARAFVQKSIQKIME